MKILRPQILSTAIALTLAGAAHAQFQGPSTGSTPYLVPSQPNIQTYSIFTVDNTGATPDDNIGGYGMGHSGRPRGLPNARRHHEWILYRAHESRAGATAGAVRTHGATGSFVSRWTINKNTLAVTAGSDLIQQVSLWNTTASSYNAPTTGIQPGRLFLTRIRSEVWLPMMIEFHFPRRMIALR